MRSQRTNAGLSHEEALRHREWTVLTPEGYTYKPEQMNHFYYAPPDRAAGYPAITRSGNVVHFSHPVFISYYQHAQPQLKRLVGNVLELLLPKPLVKAKELPSYLKVMLTRKDNQIIVHILSYLPELRGSQIQVIEEPIKLQDVKLQVRLDGVKLHAVNLAPDNIPVEFSVTSGYAEICIPEVNGYAMVVMETGKTSSVETE